MINSATSAEIGTKNCRTNVFAAGNFAFKGWQNKNGRFIRYFRINNKYANLVDFNIIFNDWINKYVPKKEAQLKNKYRGKKLTDYI